MPGAVYLLCAATSLACAILLLRSYRSLGIKLLFWSSLCFWGLALDNVLLYVDMVVVPDVDLSIANSAVGLVSALLLVFGLVWDAC